jgi:hypothetical protein
VFPHDATIKSGTWLFDGTVPVGVRIVKRDTFYGSGDHEDLPEDRENQNVTTFAVWFESTAQPGTFNTGGGQYRSLEDAVAGAEKLVGATLKWHEP